MKSKFSIFVIVSSLLLVVSSCSNSSQSKPSAVVEEQQLGDNQILNIMMTVDRGEIAAAQEATKKAVSPIVSGYAKYLIEQHQSNLEHLSQLSEELKLEPKESAISNSLIADGKNGLKALGELQGKAFDKAFIDAMVKGHQGGLKLIDSKLVPETKNPELKASVAQFRQMVSTHLEKGLEIQKSL